MPLLICARCGEICFSCKHTNTSRSDITPEHAQRIRAAYAFGARFNPLHDSTSYYLQTMDAVDPRLAELVDRSGTLDKYGHSLGV